MTPQRLRLMIFPVLLGAAERLFSETRDIGSGVAGQFVGGVQVT
ncbi:MAG TPA: hypothetical protein VLM11_03195 [Streptosporangiaceae bacterium]|nr:hypothetical protein [Streptosporangiaceae bacterium]